jgi:predicted Ser/Thr protein kinase
VSDSGQVTSPFTVEAAAVPGNREGLTMTQRQHDLNKLVSPPLLPTEASRPLVDHASGALIARSDVRWSRDDDQALLRAARDLETADCLTPNEVERAALSPETLSADRQSHLLACRLCQAQRAAAALSPERDRRLAERLAASGPLDGPEAVGPRGEELMELALASVSRGLLDDKTDLPLPLALPALARLGLPVPGQTVGPFAIEAILGAGTHGVVYRGRNRASPAQSVAIKFLARPAPSAEALQQFRSESDTVRRLAHPSIVPVFDAGFHGGLPFLVSELVEGESLADRAAGLPQDPQQAAEWVESAARAVHQLHEHGVLHRDLKPENLLFSPDGVIRVSDSGLAAFREDGPASPYAAPELLRGRQASRASDVYSLGVILRELLIGSPTIPHLTAAPPALEALCRDCLDPDPARRPATAEQVANALRAFLSTTPVAAQGRGFFSGTIYLLSLGFIDLG